MTTPNNDQFPQYPGNGAGDPNQFNNQYGDPNQFNNQQNGANQFNNQYGATNPNASFNQAPKHSGLAIAALIVGILALLTGWFPLFGWIFVVVGLILSIVALISANKKGNKKALAIVGLVLSIIGAISAGVVMWVGSQFLTGVSDECGTDQNAPGYEECVQQYTQNKLGTEN